MSRRVAKIDPNQMTIDFDAQIETYERAKFEIVKSISIPRVTSPTHGNEDEICIEIAVACKKALRDSGMSRDELVDEINGYFGRTEEREGKKPLSIHMMNNYLSKPAEYPIPVWCLQAVMVITGSLAPIQAMAEVMDAKVITGEEVRSLTLGKLDEHITQMQQLKKDLKGRR